MPAITIPWGAWSGNDETRELTFPASWRVRRIGIRGWPEATMPDYSALASRVQAAAVGARSACVAVEDITRPVYLAEVLAEVCNGLNAGGVDDAHIDIVVACGAHAEMNVAQVKAKFGDALAQRFSIRSHSMRGDLTPSGLRLGSVDVNLDRRFLAADFRVAVGSMIPNPYAGFSGAGKMMVPGLADEHTLRWIHQLAHMGGSRGPGRHKGNRVRAAIDQLASALPLHFSVMCLVDEARTVREIHAGAPADVFPQAVAAARERYVSQDEGLFDVLLCNAYPKDAEFVQSATALTPIRSGAAQALVSGGTVVLMSAAYRGMGVHRLFAPGGSMYRRPAGPLRDLPGIHMVVFAPGITAQEARSIYWDEYPFFDEWEDLLAHLTERHGPDPEAAIFGAGAVQLWSP